MGFAFSGEEASSGIRSLTIVGENKGGKHVGAMEGIEEEKSEDLLQMSQTDKSKKKKKDGGRIN